MSPRQTDALSPAGKRLPTCRRRAQVAAFVCNALAANGFVASNLRSRQAVRGHQIVSPELIVLDLALASRTPSRGPLPRGMKYSRQGPAMRGHDPPCCPSRRDRPKHA